MIDLIGRLKNALSDRYTIEREIGSGGMATVFLAEDLKHHRRVAVKVLHPELAATIGAERFLREIEIAAQLHHPHVLQLYDSGHAGGLLYYVMPYVEGGSLRTRLTREATLPVDDGVRILRDVADALAHAHKLGVVHRDVKPDNVMLSGRHALVADFGIAKALSEAQGTQLTRGGVSLGTPGYMAPEQAAGDPTVDHRADIYALGVLAYELLSGRLPFQYAAPQAILAAHVTETPEPVTLHRAGLPAALARLVMRCLEKKPEDRWQSAEEVLAQLEGLATPSGGTKSLRGWHRGRRLGRKARHAVIAAVLVTIAGAAWLLRRDGAPVLDADRVLVAGMENRTGDTALAHLGSIAVDWLTRGLQETGEIRVIDARLLAGDPLGLASAGAPGLTQAVATAKELGAGTVLSGAFYRQEDSVYFQAQVTEVASGELRQALDPVSGSLDAPLEAIELLRQRVMSMLALAALGLDMRTFPIKPPTYDAYREFMTGLTLMARGDLEGATESALRAASLDTTFTGALLLVSGSLIGRGQFARADSILQVLNRKRAVLSELERTAVDGQVARLRGDLVGWLAAARRNARFFGPSLDEVEGTLWLNRPQESIEVLEQLDPTDPLSGGRVDYWDLLHDAYHLIGDYDRALEAARTGREQYPDSRPAVLTDVETLAALGRVREVDERLREAAALPMEGENEGDVMLGVVEELRAHGHGDAAQAMLDRFFIWAEGRPAEERETVEHRWRMAVGLGLAGRVTDARARLRDVAVDGGVYPMAHGALLGVLAAIDGDTQVSADISEGLRQLEDPYLFGANTLFRARIAAMLGDRERAVALLREAFAQGLHYGMWLHRDVTFESLRDYPPFQDLLRPKG